LGVACVHRRRTQRSSFVQAVAERLAPGGALLIADLVAPASEMSKRLAADAWDRSAQVQARTSDDTDQYSAFIRSGWNRYRHADPDDHPSELLHQLVWLKHAGFPKVDCAWLFAGHAVFGGFK
jgi:tRNA (cmo5U34)-methyltransferase